MSGVSDAVDLVAGARHGLPGGSPSRTPQRVSRRLRLLLNDARASCRLALVAWRWARRRRAPVRDDVVVTLTSYGGRFRTLHWTLKCLLTQSVAPRAVVLWVGHDDRNKIPPAVEALRIEGLEIRATADIGSYTKIIPSLLAFPQAAIVTADDDIFYPRDWLKSLLAAWQGDRGVVVVHRAHEMRLLADGSLAPYNSWRPDVAAARREALLFPTGVAGILYPPGVLHALTVSADLFLSLCPSADDVWLYWMGRINGARVRLSGFRFRLVNWPGSQGRALADANIGRNQNDAQIKTMLKRWPIAFAGGAE